MKAVIYVVIFWLMLGTLIGVLGTLIGVVGLAI